MKLVSTTALLIKLYRQLIIVSRLLVMLLISANLLAQTDSTKTAKPTEEVSSMLSPSVEFIGIQKADTSIDLKASLKAKFKGSFIKLSLLKVKFFLLTDTTEKELGFAITDRIGSAIFNCKADALTTNKEGKLHFKAVFAGNKSMDPAEEEVTFKRARLEITPAKEDSLLTVKLKLIDVGTGTEIPVPETVVGIFVKRSFNPLKVGEGTTDINGEASVEIPNNLPGDAKGNITLLARLDENELYGNLEAGVTQQWGNPVSDISQELPRALWSSHPPIWMLITFIILITAVWGHYIVIIYELFRLRKEEPHTSTNATNS